MKNEKIRSFVSPSFGTVRTVVLKGVPYFCVRDLSLARGLHYIMHTERMPSSERAHVKVSDCKTRMVFVTYKGMRDVLLNGRDDKGSLVFQWIASEVYPALVKKTSDDLDRRAVKEDKPQKRAADLIALLDDLDCVYEKAVSIVDEHLGDDSIAKGLSAIDLSLRDCKLSLMGLLQSVVIRPARDAGKLSRTA